MSEPAKVQLDFSGLVERLVPRVAELFATLASQDPLKMSFADVASKTVLDMVEESLIARALKDCRNNQVHTARMLGISRNTLRHRIKKYGLEGP